ncbi:MAG: Ig-like domain-containing protein [Bacteroidota bacterium]
MKKQLKLWCSIFLIGGMLVFSGCGDDDDGPAALELTAISATGTEITSGNSVTIDLNAATSAVDVPPDATITVTFSREVDPASVNSAAVTVNNGTDDETVDLTANGNALVITPQDELEQGTDYTLTINASIQALDGGSIMSTTRSFKTAGRKAVIPPQAESQKIYLSFDGNVTDEEGNTILNDDVSYTTDRFNVIDGSADFNGTTNYVGIQYSADIIGSSQTISYWIRLPESDDYNTHVRTTSYVTLALGGNDGFYHEFGRFSENPAIDFLKYLTIHENDGTDGGLIRSFDENKQEGREVDPPRTFEKDNFGWLEVATSEWLHIVTVYDEATSTKSFYFNGELGTEFTFTASDDGKVDRGAMTIDSEQIANDPTNNNNLYLGSGIPFWATLNMDGSITPFRANVAHAFKGQMDDFRLWTAALSATEVKSLYDAEKP